MGIQTKNKLYNFATIENCLDWCESEINLGIVKMDESYLKEQFKLAREIIREHYKKEIIDWIKNGHELEAKNDEDIIAELYSLTEECNEEFYIRELFTEDEILKLYKESHSKAY